MSFTMQNGSTIAAISPAYDSPWIVWQHPASAIALLAVILSIVILVAAIVSNACLLVHSYGLDTWELYSTRQKNNRSDDSGVGQHQQLQTQPPCLTEA